MSDRRTQILESLRDGFKTIRMLEIELGLDESNVGRWLNKLEAEGLVERLLHNKALFWRLKNEGAKPEPPAKEINISFGDFAIESTPVRPKPSNRVLLAEELVDLERRRLEILEALK